MQFIGTLEASKIAGVTQSTVSYWCRSGKISAEQDKPGSPWRIPANTIFPNGRSAATYKKEAEK